MKAIEYYLKKFRRDSISRKTSIAITSTSVLTVKACGSGQGASDTQVKGFPNSYVGPSSDYISPVEIDPNFETLKTAYTEPYWVASLEMDRWDNHVTPMLENFNRSISFTFPETAPAYDTFGLTGWEPATFDIKTATREILAKFEEILNVTFNETYDPDATNVIAVGTSSQATTAGFSYFPNNSFEIGMDVFIAKGYTSPNFTNELITNYDYEVLVHEIGHALGLKHPFEAAGANTATLSAYEDNTRNTAMSYDQDEATFNGTLRPLDWMALTKLYGVKSTYKSGDDIYEFSSSGGTFILDGAGVDTINVYNTTEDVTIDLRPGAHSHLGAKSSYITDTNQLTISHGSDIENVLTGKGNDNVVGSNLDNVIETGSGSDTIFAGNGSDIIKSGTGADRIDLSETIQSVDVVTLDAPSINNLNFDIIYGFSQGASGDIFDISEVLGPSFEILPLVVVGSAPTGNFSGGILRITGSEIATATDLSNTFELESGLKTLSMDSGSSALIISSDSQSTGEDQRIFFVERNIAEMSVTQLAVLQGNALDIDQWHLDNFSYIV